MAVAMAVAAGTGIAAFGAGHFDSRTSSMFLGVFGIRGRFMYVADCYTPLSALVGVDQVRMGAKTALGYMA